MTKLYLDTETRAAANLTKLGVEVYVRDPHFRVLLLTWAIDDGPVRLWSPISGARMPLRLHRALKDPAVRVVAHGSSFDRKVMSADFIADIPPERIIDTMVQAYAHGLPGGLGELSKVLGLTQGKLEEGRDLIRLFCAPRKDAEGKRALERGEALFYDKASHPAEWDRFCKYAVRDVEAMREAHRKMPQANYPNLEHRLWVYDQRMNDRGLPIDMELARAGVQERALELARLAKATKKATGGEVGATTQNAKLLMHLALQHDVWLPDLQEGTLRRRLDLPDLPQTMRNLMENRLSAAQNASSKYQRVIERAVEIDGNWRLCGTIQMYGASGSGRDSGRVFQPQNLKRPTVWRGLHDEELEDAIERDVQDIKDGIISITQPDKVMDVLGSCVRGVIAPAPGHLLVQADLSNIEGRKLVWLSGEDWKLKFFRDFDAGKVKFDNYVAAYAKSFGIDPSEVTSEQRAVGKVEELALGYGGGVAAFVSFAELHHIDLEQLAKATYAVADRHRFKECADKWEWAKKAGFSAGLPRFQYAACEYIKQMWREGHPKTVKFWKDLDLGFRQAVTYERETFRVGPIAFRRQGGWLYMRLPSGRLLTYLNPRIHRSGDITAMRVNSLTRRLERQKVYSGILAENATSGSSRDVLFGRIPEIEDTGFKIVCRVHDEFITEVPEGSGLTHKKLSEIMTQPYDWAPGLPLAAAGFTTSTRYRKD